MSLSFRRSLVVEFVSSVNMKTSFTPAMETLVLPLMSMVRFCFLTLILKEPSYRDCKEPLASCRRNSCGEEFNSLKINSFLETCRVPDRDFICLIFSRGSL